MATVNSVKLIVVYFKINLPESSHTTTPPSTPLLLHQKQWDFRIRPNNTHTHSVSCARHWILLQHLAFHLVYPSICIEGEFLVALISFHHFILSSGYSFICWQLIYLFQYSSQDISSFVKQQPWQCWIRWCLLSKIAAVASLLVGGDGFGFARRRWQLCSPADSFIMGGVPSLEV